VQRKNDRCPDVDHLVLERVDVLRQTAAPPKAVHGRGDFKRMSRQQTCRFTVQHMIIVLSDELLNLLSCPALITRLYAACINNWTCSKKERGRGGAWLKLASLSRRAVSRSRSTLISMFARALPATDICTSNRFQSLLFLLLVFDLSERRVFI